MVELAQIILVATFVVVYLVGMDLNAPSTKMTVCPLVIPPCVLMVAHALIKLENMIVSVLLEKWVSK